MIDDGRLAWTVVRAELELDGQRVPIDVGVPVRVLEGLAADLRSGGRPWRASFTSGVSIRIATPRTDGYQAPDKKRQRRAG